jgi:ParB/RepB/Spo0J family partition protein
MSKAKPKAAQKESTIDPHPLSIAVDALEVWHGNRRQGTEAGIEELAASIKEQGILQPILVRPGKSTTRAKYEVICGKRRLAASIIAEFEMIPCYVRQMTDKEAAAAVATENIQREDFTAWDAYIAVDAAMSAQGSAEDAALSLGKPVGWVRRVASLDGLTGDWTIVAKDNPAIPLAFLERVARLPEAAQQEILEIHSVAELAAGGEIGYVDDTESDWLDTIDKCDWLKASKICEVCGRRSDVQEELFPELASTATCPDKECREKRKQEYIVDQREKAAKMAKKTPDEVKTTEYAGCNDVTTKDKRHTVPVVLTAGARAGEIRWRPEPTQGPDSTDATPNGPSPAQRAAAKYIRDMEKQVHNGLVHKWTEQASTEALLAAVMIFGISGTAEHEPLVQQFEAIMNRKGTKQTEADIADGIKYGILARLRFDKVSTCDATYEAAKNIAEILEAPTPKET